MPACVCVRRGAGCIIVTTILLACSLNISRKQIKKCNVCLCVWGSNSNLSSNR